MTVANYRASLAEPARIQDLQGLTQLTFWTRWPSQRLARERGNWLHVRLRRRG